jgi:hypothetical protein
MATEYSHSYGLANLTIGAPWFDSNNCESINETGLRTFTVQWLQQSRELENFGYRLIRLFCQCACMELKLHCG